MRRIITLSMAVLMTPVIVFFSPEAKAQHGPAAAGSANRPLAMPGAAHCAPDEYEKFIGTCSPQPYRQQPSRLPSQQKKLEDMTIEERANRLFPTASQGDQRTQYIIDEMRAAADRQQGNSYSIHVK
jgi:hypothetical protein